jgi:small subunit ribosomal protein S4
MGEKLFLKGDKCVSDKCVLPRRMESESMRGGGGRRRGRGRKLSAYSIQLMEKQKIKAIYGVAETQFHNYFRRAAKKPNTGDALLSLLESRLDNVIYRLGFANSRPEARLLVRHGHITINGRRTDLPSYIVRPGQNVGVRDENGLKVIKSTLANKDPTTVPWLSLDKESAKGMVVRLPAAEDTKEMIANVQLVVELYSK